MKAVARMELKPGMVVAEDVLNYPKFPSFL